MKLWRITLAVWFITYGILAITDLRIQFASFLLGVLAIVFAILLLLDR